MTTHLEYHHHFLPRSYHLCIGPHTLSGWFSRSDCWCSARAPGGGWRRSCSLTCRHPQKHCLPSLSHGRPSQSHLHTRDTSVAVQSEMRLLQKLMSYYNCDATLLPQIYLVAIIQISGLNSAPLTKFRPESRFRLSEFIYIRETEHAQLTFTDFNFAIKCCYPEKNVTELPIGPLKFSNNVHNNAINCSKMANSEVSITVPTGLPHVKHREQEAQDSGTLIDIMPYTPCLLRIARRVVGHKLRQFFCPQENNFKPTILCNYWQYNNIIKI